MNNVAAIVLAAGKGTRMRSAVAKVLHPLLGRPLLAYPLDACRAVGIERFVAVVGHQSDEVERQLAAPDVRFSLQAEQKGTAHAAQCALPVLGGVTGTALILCGILRVESLNRAGMLSDINFTAYAGEVLGIAGLVGAGRTELARAVFGADLIDSGKFFVKGQPVKIANPNDAIQHGIGLLTEDRKQQGLFLQMSVRDNIVMAVLKRLTRGLRTNRRKEADVAQRYIDGMNIKASSQEQLAINLSGGTQQKVVLGKWMSTEPRVLIFDEPTRGIDVGAKVEIYKMMNELARQGVAIMMISSELPEIR